MKKVLIVPALILIFNSVFSQDLIVTSDGDSINCKIHKIKTDHIYFTFKHKDEIRNTLLSLSSVKIHKFKYFKTTEVPKDKIVSNSNYQKFRIAINAGYSNRTAKLAGNIPSDFKGYYKNLKSGYHYGGDVTYYYNEQLGFGLKYYLFKSSNSLDNVYSEDSDGNRTYGILSDDMTITFIAPTFSTRLLSHDKKNAFLMNFAFGYMGYTNNSVFIDEYFKLTGGTLGLSFDLGYDIGLSENLSLGFQISILNGTLTKVQKNDGLTTTTIDLKKDEFESLKRVDVSVGLRFHK